MTYRTGATMASLGLPTAKGDEDYVERVKHCVINLEEMRTLQEMAQTIGVSDEFKKVIQTFKTPAGQTPAGFEITFALDSDKVLRANLARNISYDKNGMKRPTNVLFSADTANPYEVEPVKDMLANLTCNPGIIYDLFLNNPKANVGNVYKTRDEVMQAIGNTLGPGADISVELNDPFGKSDAEILEEAAKFKELLTEYRVVIKVPHTGPVNKDNVKELLENDKKLSLGYRDVSTTDAFRGHNLALLLHENGYRVNFTLMFEPYQTALALQARPYFINSFIRHRLKQSQAMAKHLDLYAASSDTAHLEALRQYMIDTDYLPKGDANLDWRSVQAKAQQILDHRHLSDEEGADGLDGVRHNLRMLRQSNLPDTRLIICSMEGEDNYPDIDKLLATDEFSDMISRVVITAEPNYLAQFTSANQVISYQRRFMNAANGKS